MTTLCPKKDVCGSCGWSHIPYAKQLTQKISDINGSLALKNLSTRVDEILPSTKTAHYRNRMDFVIDFEGRVGLREKGKWWRVIDNHPCFLADERIDDLFAVVRTWAQTCGLTFYDRKARTGLLRYAVIRASAIGQTMINIVTSAPEDEPHVLHALGVLQQHAQPTTLLWSVNATESDVSYGERVQTVFGPGYIEESIAGYTYRISPNAFFQTNSYAAPLLLDTVKEFCGDLSDKTLLDLYCGTGFFSVALAESARQTFGVELSADAIRDARINAQTNAVNVAYIDAPTESYDWSVHNADVVILDPPRAGMHDRALQDVLRTAPNTIVYVSCNPKNFARELVLLQERYSVARMRAIDMFPHTPHVELVTRLERKY